jgi:hypothetical protein
MEARLFQVPAGYENMVTPGTWGGKVSRGAVGSGDENDENDEGAPKPPAKGKTK